MPTILGRKVAATSPAPSPATSPARPNRPPPAEAAPRDPADRREASPLRNPFASPPHPMGAIHKRAVWDPRVGATIVASRPLLFTDGADEAADRPGIVRAGSGVAYFEIGCRPHLAVVQDDVSAIALVDLTTGRVDPVLLPANAKGERAFGEALGNKKRKMDLEAATLVHIDGKQVVLAMGSGSLENRESIVLLHVEDSNRVEVLPAHDFYAALRANKSFSGSELNIEGVTLLADGNIRLFQRGNGEAAGPLRPLDSTADVSFDHLYAYLRDPSRKCPAVHTVRNYDLGSVEGTKITFADAAHAGGRCFFVGSAEASDGAINDGENLAAVFGIIDAKGEARIGVLRAADGTPSRDKPEGLTLDPKDPRRAYAVVDNDDPNTPTQLLTLRLDDA